MASSDLPGQGQGQGSSGSSGSASRRPGATLGERRLAGASAAARLEAQPLPELPSMDPRLQRAMALHRGGARRMGSASTSGDELAVIARVRNVEAWHALSEVRNTEVIGAPDDEGCSIVTARVAIERLARVHELPFVASLKAAQRVHLQLDHTLAETECRPADLAADGLAANGSGVVVGIVDFGCDVAHRNLRHDNNGTRLRALWDQGNPAKPSAGVAYGVVHRTADIDAALATPDPYAALDYAVALQEHGTHVTDIAAGNGRGTGLPGVAPQADLVFVQLAASDIAWSGPDVAQVSFGDSVQLLEAASFIFRQAGDQPCVVNLSLGTNGGPHDGSTLVERGLDSLVRQAPGRAIVIAAANARDDGIHARAVIAPGAAEVLPLFTLPGAEDEVEFWFDSADRDVVLELIAPDGSSVARVDPGQSIELRTHADDPPVAVLVSRQGDPNNGDNVINLWMSPDMPKGRWEIRLSNSGVRAVEVHGWIERNDRRQASFGAAASDPAFTLGSISCGRESIVVGSYDAHKQDTPISWFSAEGPTRDGRNKPDLSGPGHGVRAAASRTGNGTTVMSGTSMAAPAVTGIVALMFDEAARGGMRPGAALIRQLLIRACHPVGAGGWDSRYGAGRVRAADAVREIQLAAQAASAIGAQPAVVTPP
jgi:subtilisin family serine protease